MLDIKFIREHSDLVKEAARKKRIDFDVEKLIEVDDIRLGLLQEVEKMRAEQNKASDNIAFLNGDEKEKAVVEMKELKEVLQKKEDKLKKIISEWKVLMLAVPNVPDPSVPDGASDEDNKEIRKWGEIPQFNFDAKNHIELMQNLNLVDFERGAKVSGFRGYFLKNDAVLLSMAIWQFTIDMMRENGFEDLFMAPALARGKNFEGTGWFSDADNKVYQVENDLYLLGTSEVSMMGLHSDEVLKEEELPKTYLAFSPCYRSESGSYGKDTKGLVRVHEFYKMEQIVLCEADHQESVRWHEEINKNTEKIIQALKIPYRVVMNCGADLGLGQVKKYDIELWVPGENKYREISSASYFHDFQTRRLNIRYRDKDGNIRFAHSLNATAIPTPRILVSIIENYQQEDGTILIPEVLKKYMNKDLIS